MTRNLVSALSRWWGRIRRGGQETAIATAVFTTRLVDHGRPTGEKIEHAAVFVVDGLCRRSVRIKTASSVAADLHPDLQAAILSWRDHAVLPGSARILFQPSAEKRVLDLIPEWRAAHGLASAHTH